MLVLFQVTSNKPDRPIAQEPVKQVDDVLLTMKLQEEELLQNFGADHPQVVAIRKRMSTIRDHLEKNATATNAANPTTSATDLIHLYVQILEEEKKKNEEIQKSLRANLESDRGIVRPLELLAHRETTLKDQREYLKKRLFNLEEGRKTIELTRDAPLYDFRIINPAGEGGKVSPIATSTVSLGAILGLLLGIGLAFLAEFTDQSFHSAEEIRRRLGVSVIGHIPPLTPHEATAPDQQALDPMLVVHHRPPSMEAEAHRGLRTSLYFSTVGKGHQVIQITSPNPHDGKSTIIANLAVSIAQSGKKIVLIDCDFRKPRIHQIFGLATSEVGLASVLLQEADLDQAIQTCAVAGLHLLPCGPRPTNPAELLSSQRYRELLDQIRTRYDFVLIDTPPLLAVSDPAVVSTQVGGVILVTRLTKTARPAAERAKEILSAMGANLLGVVVNDSEADRSSYNYGYNYQYAEDYSEEKTDERTASSDLPRQSR